MPRYRRYFKPGQIVFVTISTANRIPWLRSRRAKRMLVQEWRRTRDYHPFKNLGYVILDDHLHWLFAPEARTDISILVASLKRGVTSRHGQIPGVRSLWQKRFYDHVIRDEDDYRRHLDYIHYNPVKHGYAKAPFMYRWSSFRAWVGRGVYDLHWGMVEPGGLGEMDLE